MSESSRWCRDADLDHFGYNLERNSLCRWVSVLSCQTSANGKGGNVDKNRKWQNTDDVWAKLLEQNFLLYCIRGQWFIGCAVGAWTHVLGPVKANGGGWQNKDTVYPCLSRPVTTSTHPERSETDARPWPDLKSKTTEWAEDFELWDFSIKYK